MRWKGRAMHGESDLAFEDEKNKGNPQMVEECLHYLVYMLQFMLYNVVPRTTIAALWLTGLSLFVYRGHITQQYYIQLQFY